MRINLGSSLVSHESENQSDSAPPLRIVVVECHSSHMTRWLGYESVFSFQETAHAHWCRIDAMILAQTVTIRRDLDGGDEAPLEARRRASAKVLSKHEVRRWLVALASSDGREILSYGYDSDGLIASVIFHPAHELKYEPVWVSREDSEIFMEMYEILQKTSPPFPRIEQSTAAESTHTESHE